MSSILGLIEKAVDFFGPQVPEKQAAQPQEVMMDPIEVPTNRRLLTERLGADPKVQEIFEKYFVAYAKDFLPLDEPAFSAIKKIAEIEKFRSQIADAITGLLKNGELDSTHRSIPDQNLILTALDMQSVFDQEVLRLRKIDACRRLRFERVEPELKLLKQAVKPEPGLLAEIEQKSFACQRSYRDQLRISIEMREGLVAKLQEKIQTLENTTLSPEEEKLLAPSFMSRILQFAKGQKTFPLQEPDSVHSTIRDHYVFAVGDPILNPKDAKFMIVKRPAGLSHEKWTSKEFREKVIKECPYAPNQSAFIDIEGKTVEVCYENVAEATKWHMNRDISDKTRRRNLGNGQYERSNRNLEDRGFFRALVRFAQKISADKWSQHRESTVGPDCHEALVLSRTLIEHILQGRADRISQNDFQNLVEYFDSLPHNDVVDLKGSYMEDPRFRQAMELHEAIYRNLKRKYENATILPYLEKGIGAEYSVKKDFNRIQQLIVDVFQSYGTWNENLSIFIKELEKEENAPIRESIGNEMMYDLRTLSQALEHFMRWTPQDDLKEAFGGKLHQWLSTKTPEDVDLILSNTLTVMQENLKHLYPKLIPVSVWFSSGSRQNQMKDLMSPQLFNSYQRAIPQVWQNKAKLQMLFENELMKGTELSPIWLKMAETLEVADQELVSSEFRRSRQSKKMLGHLIV